MDEDGIDLLARLERLEKRVLELENPKFDISCDRNGYVCDHNYPIL